MQIPQKEPSRVCSPNLASTASSPVCLLLEFYSLVVLLTHFDDFLASCHFICLKCLLPRSHWIPLIHSPRLVLSSFLIEHLFWPLLLSLLPEPKVPSLCAAEASPAFIFSHLHTVSLHADLHLNCKLLEGRKSILFIFIHAAINRSFFLFFLFFCFDLYISK